MSNSPFSHDNLFDAKAWNSKFCGANADEATTMTKVMAHQGVDNARLCAILGYVTGRLNSRESAAKIVADLREALGILIKTG